MEKGLKLWHSLQEKAQPIEDWVGSAEEILAQDEEPTDALIAQHKVGAHY